MRQHVHTDPWSEHNHSRNFTGALFNLLTFNAGYHTVHHDQPGAHWSTHPEAHARIAHHIHPELQPDNFLSWCMRSYVLSLVSPRFGTQQIGRAPFEPPPEAI
jgi:fatty acid desaturase